uniref:NADP-dependent oxidoreductase domain-containing protein n=1 Tax=Tetraselmis chuii TaxID=63592 RepID=A0A7S1SPM4_9CHLO|mmetsp:Transcript_21749/g.38770  ORF Transcript_21749/g.38770 Transcript_21749/m.38770 type:complete len:390 (+) Transcript_21749:156-1325(+)
MSSDGVQEPNWYGTGGFPHLMHGPNFRRNGPSSTSHNYGELRAGSQRMATQAASDVHTRAGHGTWNGPAPRGAGEAALAAMEAKKAAEAASRAVNEPKTVYVSGRDMPLLGLRTNKLASADAISAAVAAGFRMFDCAPSYGTEALVGEGLKAVTGVPRDQLYIASKLPNDAHQPAAVSEACAKSLADLGCDYLDLYLVEWPEAWLPGTQQSDESANILQTWAAMEKLVDEGLVKAIGVANFGLATVEEILGACRIKPTVNQVELHPLLADRKMVGVLFRKGVQCVASCPLAGRSSDLLAHPSVAALAAELGRSAHEVLLKWNTQRGIPVLPSMSEDLAVDAAAFFSWKLNNAQKAALDKLDAHRRFFNVDWHTWDDPEKGGALKPSLVL